MLIPILIPFPFPGGDGKPLGPLPERQTHEPRCRVVLQSSFMPPPGSYFRCDREAICSIRQRSLTRFERRVLCNDREGGPLRPSLATMPTRITICATSRRFRDQNRILALLLGVT